MDNYVERYLIWCSVKAILLTDLVWCSFKTILMTVFVWCANQILFESFTAARAIFFRKCYFISWLKSDNWLLDSLMTYHWYLCSTSYNFWFWAFLKIFLGHVWTLCVMFERFYLRCLFKILEHFSGHVWTLYVSCLNTSMRHVWTLLFKMFI